jgi:hypothetical protein
MKTIRIRLTTAMTVALLFSVFAVRVLGYPAKYGPFQPGQEPAAIVLDKCGLVREVKPPTTNEFQNPAGAVREYLLQAGGQGQPQFTLALRGTANGWVINLRDAQGRNLMPAPFTNRMTSSQMEVFSCDLNGDSQPDFIVNVWSGGCGLAAEGSEVTFLLSGKDGYRAASFYLYAFGNQDLVRFKAQGPVYFIFNDLIGSSGEKTRDGREHNFWVYELNRIDGNRIIPADANQPGFPKWVWFTNHDNHTETTQLSQVQKTSLLVKRNLTGQQNSER